MTNFIKNNAKYLTIGGAFILLVVCYFQQKELSKLRTQTTQHSTINIDSLIHLKDSIQYNLDSLDAEMFPMEVELNRYQTAYKIFLKRDPQGAKIYGDIISEETE